MALELNGTTGVNLVQDGTVTAADLASTLDLTGKTVTLPAGTANAGKVLQVVQNTTTSQIVTTSTSYTASGLSVSITPASTSSKIFIMANIWPKIGNSDGFITFYRNGSTDVLPSGYFHAANTAERTNMIGYLDSPNTASAISYELYFRTGNASVNIYLNGTGRHANIIAMEIAA
jgi:hypothetical protein